MKKLIIVLVCLTGCASSSGSAPSCKTADICATKSQSLLFDANTQEGLSHLKQACILDVQYCERYYNQMLIHDKTRHRQVRAEICLGAHPTECVFAGVNYIRIKPIHPKKAMRLFEHGCQKNVMESCYSVALMYQGRLLKKTSLTRARKYYKMACDRSHEKSCTNLAITYLQTNDPKDVSTAMAMYHTTCKRFGGDSCVELGTRYIAGNGVKQDSVRGMAMLKKACAQKNGRGCMRYGDELRVLAKTNEDRITSINILSLACEYDSKLGCLRAAEYAQKYNLVLNQKTILKFRRMAHDYFVDACHVSSLGYACWRLGEMIERKWATDKKPAQFYYDMACRLDKRTCSWNKRWK